jgi:tetratricopeptide (TPR) repeat protein
MDPSRVQFLEAALVANPDDRFARYALAMELSQSTASERAWKHFEYLLKHHPDYAATYLQAGMYLAHRGQSQEASAVFKQGLEVTRHQGEIHAQRELQTALEELEENMK